ncbi:MAG: ribonuclease Z [Nanoarchaeota archaeon]|nr:ribonuclease Z [Nanoarchaeota archaeon]MBU1622179.1 ribonuclease Z [Nanoarchaeota archaeon]
MRVVFLGVGEAFDENNPNNAHLILSKTKLLLDCGYSVPVQLWKYNSNQSFLDAVYISHRHADHYFGICPLLTRMWEEKRSKPLTIICQKGLKKVIIKLLEIGYPGFPKKFKFKINFIEVKSGQTINFKELKLSFAPTRHTAYNLAIKVDDGKQKVCYSGDGDFTNKTEQLYHQADLVIHESYLFQKSVLGHSSVTKLIAMAKRNEIKCLALTHLQRAFRKKDLQKVKQRIKQEKVKIILAQPGKEYKF